MTVSVGDIKSTITQILLQEFLPGEDANDLGESLPLLSSGILDSLAMLKLVTLIEGRYGVELQPHDLSTDRFDTIALMAATVQRKIELN